ncbi:MAG: hypothetical protein QM308_05940 [Bacillota bacterium]|nr:hypothetical protein [Bacillota bacterium]
MKLRVKKTWADFRHHLQYSALIYPLIIALSIALVNLIYTQTAYRPPQEKRIDIYIQSSSASQEFVNEFITPIWESAVPDMELVNVVLLMSPGGENDYYANMQLMTYIAAGEGDIYMLSSSDFKRFASQGAFVDLGDAIEQGLIDVNGLEINSAKVVEVDIDADGNMVALGDAKQFGIPAAGLYKFATDLSIDNRDMVLAVAVNSNNEEPTIRFLNALVQATRAEVPDFFK